ncbi:NAD-dependent epimerase/dehydratase family protein [Spirulina sp. 06S082]|uniref:NAD-dependent epimerase/dehydratase family protein n=1 Tax=Spirulina sp. 06S082 TaxID=3110248 RepID=UPI002B1EFFB6|nr:NAD-dependent epimerase/dehydratase family protein [Spirulina sp. 06S082]MEA5468844.1 NAD-dependent epimerase/dehydratase family protein [Spirulina sp. 06S082]
MKVLVTGGCGFLGYHICVYFRDRGEEVIAYDNLAKHEFARNPYMTPAARDYNRSQLEEMGVEIVVEDIRNKAALLEYSSQCDYICHTAAQPAMTISWENPELDFSTNTLGTFNVLESARTHQIPVAICSSIHTFGPDRINASLTEAETRYLRQPPAIDESEPLLQGTVTPLHASKRSNEIYLQAYIDTFKLKAACFRLTGIYGPNQFGGEDHGWVANFAIRAMLGLPLTIFGTGKQVRDILYARDAAAAFGAFYRSPQPGIYNLGGGVNQTISLLECIDRIEKILECKADVNFKEGRFGDLRYFVTDSSKFQRATGWEARVQPEQGITELIQWLQNSPNLFTQDRSC